MKVMAFKRLSVLMQNGLADGKSYIAPGDLCEVGEKTLTGLYPVTYPTSKGKKTRWVRTLKGFLCNQNEYPDLGYPAPGYLKATIKSGGCGVCAAVNVVGALDGKAISVRVMRDLAVNGGANAALLAAQILAVSDAEIAAKLDAKRIADAKVVLEKDAGVMEKL